MMNDSPEQIKKIGSKKVAGCWFKLANAKNSSAIRNFCDTFLLSILKSQSSEEWTQKTNSGGIFEKSF
jgi:hypothetical protein